MNKYEAAIAYFKERKAILAAKSFEDEAVEHINTAIEAMKKQVPRTVIESGAVDWHYCPNCGRVIDQYDEHCMNCGQAVNVRLTECVSRKCFACRDHTTDGPVCENYADKIDEIRRIHEEA